MPIAVAVKPMAEGEEAQTILQRIEWQTKGGNLMRCDREPDGSGTWVTRKKDITVIPGDTEGSLIRPSMLFDFHSATNGWVRFTPYDEVMVGLCDALPPRPPVYRDERGNPVKNQWGNDVRHEQTIRVPVYSPRVFGKDEPLREFSVRGINTIADFGQFFGAAVELAPEYLAGKLPLIQFADKRDVGKGNYTPVLKVLGWHDRPEAVPLRKPAPTAAPKHEPEVAAKQAVDLDDEIPF